MGCRDITVIRNNRATLISLSLSFWRLRGTGYRRSVKHPVQCQTVAGIDWSPPCHVTAFLREFVECATVSIPPADGGRLAARVFERSRRRALARR